MDKDKVIDILIMAKIEIQKMAGDIDSLTLYEVYLLLIFIAQYLYAYCAHDGRLVGNNYEVVPATLTASGKFGTWTTYACNIIKARNTICHSFGLGDEMKMVNNIVNNRKQIIMFLKFLKVIEEPISDPLADLMAVATAAIE